MNIIAAVFSILLFVAGLVLFGYSFEVAGYEALMFLGGIAATSVAVLIPVQFLNRSEH